MKSKTEVARLSQLSALQTRQNGEIDFVQFPMVQERKFSYEKEISKFMLSPHIRME